MFNIIPTDLYTKTGQWLRDGLCYDNLGRNRIKFFVFKNSQSIFYEIRNDFQMAWNLLLIFHFIENGFFWNSNWNSINGKLKHFQFVQNSMNKSWSFKNASAYLRPIFQFIEFEKNIQCVWICSCVKSRIAQDCTGSCSRFESFPTGQHRKGLGLPWKKSTVADSRILPVYSSDFLHFLLLSIIISNKISAVPCTSW
jgi:hypothetical protein